MLCHLNSTKQNFHSGLKPLPNETFLYVAIFHTRNPSKQNPEKERKRLCFEKWESELASVARGRNGVNIYSHCKIGASSLSLYKGEMGAEWVQGRDKAVRHI